MMLEAWSLCRPNLAAISMGTTPIETYYAGSSFNFHFPYPLFAWLPLYPTSWMYVLAGLLATAGLAMAAGFRTRIASALVFILWGYFFAVESTRSYWQSHYYIELLFSFLLIWMPTGRCFSVDALLARRQGNPLPHTVPFWTVFTLRGQLVIAYFYAGVAKLNADWLLDAIPVRWFLMDSEVTRPYEAVLSAGQLEALTAVLQSVWFAYFIAYTGLVFDLAVGFLFLFRRTRMFALLLMLIFHATNHFLIFDDIDWFPLAGATTALIFLDADWPQRAWAWLRQPRIGKPDWNWLIGGALVFPGVGALLGWKLRPHPLPARHAGERHRVRTATAWFVALWLTWQTLLPARHYLIPGDGRFTYEGLSFSWRLKSDRRNARGALLIVKDDRVLQPGPGAGARIDWSAWRGDPVIYRRVSPGAINWQRLPELVVVLQPRVGERVFHNPLAAGSTARSATAVNRRAREVWQSLHGHPPANVHPVLSLAEFCRRTASTLTTHGHTPEAGEFLEFTPVAEAIDEGQIGQPIAGRLCAQLRALLNPLLNNPNLQDELVGLVRQTGPFALDGEPHSAVPFLILEDPAVTGDAFAASARIKVAAWKHGPVTREPGPAGITSLGGEPVVVYTSDLGTEAGQVLPQSFILDILNAGQPPAIYWNSLKDLSPSKSIHISNQAFFLRRYARRVAALWEAEHGRRPVINALTSVSLNGRPFQELVDPEADMASVSVKWFGHNEWIRDLQTPRIPREALLRGENQ